MAGSNELKDPIAKCKTVVDCTANPLDVSPASKVIAETIKGLAKTATPERPYAFIIGCMHPVSAQTLMIADVVRRLQDEPEETRAKFVLSLEHPHDELEKTLYDAVGAPIPEDLKGWVSLTDTTGHRTLGAALAFRAYAFAPESEALLAELCTRYGASARFNDAARSEDHDHLDFSDTLTASFAKAKQRTRDIPVVSEEGMAMRNRMMAALGMAHMRAEGASIAVFECGADHAVGTTRSNGPNNEVFKTRDSLARACEELGFIPVVCLHDSYMANGIPKIAGRYISNGVCIKGLSTREFEYGETAEEMRHIAAVVNESKMNVDLIARVGFAAELKERYTANLPYLEDEAREKKAEHGGILPLRR